MGTSGLSCFYVYIYVGFYCRVTVEGSGSTKLYKTEAKQSAAEKT